MNILFLGPAASGKTTLVWRFGNYLEKLGYEVSRINLDCAVESLPYKPDFDIRKYFTLSGIMKKYMLGPNGALMKSVELIWRKRKEIAKSLKGDFSLIDTPGQLELVIFHPLKISGIFKNPRGVCVFLIPADLLKSASDYYFLRFMNLAIKYRVSLPCVFAISKADLIKRKMSMKKLRDDFSASVYEILKKLEETQRIVYVSKYGKGFKELHSLIYESFCVCGDLS